MTFQNSFIVIYCKSVKIEPWLISQLIKLQVWGLFVAQKFGNSFFRIQHAQIRLDDISEHFYQKMHSHVAFCVIYTRLIARFFEQRNFHTGNLTPGPEK